MPNGEAFSKKTLGQFVKDERELLKISRERLALDAGISVETLANIERSRGHPHLGTVMAVLEALGFRLLVDRVDAGEEYSVEIISE